MLSAAQEHIAGPQLPEAEPPLADAFKAFSAAARSLQRSYLSLGEEVRRLRSELSEEHELRLRREALARMSALVAHEVRNPLGSIEMFADLLASSGITGEKKEWLEQIQSGIRILSATVNNVLEFHSPVSLKLSHIDLSPVLGALQKFLQPITERAGMTFIVEVTERPLFVLADQQRLMQTFLNIALNAVRFAAEGGMLRISASREKDIVVIQFEDRGQGISAEVREKLFAPGFTTRSGGPGLGMAVAKTIVEQHRGTIHLRSSSGNGTRFQVRLPLVIEQ
ncbi:MAG TPA: HAMP domain-containing sensor histidine kinase [Terriglobales bacterium]|nr:HAMP domain-containing sensor histidine kinase [Terriglobales bacterium]